MLTELKVENFAIISSLLFCPNAGLNILSGETGAGKSLVADALAALALGQTGDELVKSGADSAKISGLFHLQGERLERINDILRTKGIVPEMGGDIVLSCEIKKAGRSSFRINGDTVSRGVMQDVGTLLVDIHGQSDHLSLLNPASHLHILDTYADLMSMAQEYTAGYKTLRENIDKYKALQMSTAERASQSDFLTFQLNEIEQARLKVGEDDDLLAQKQVLSHAESIKSACFEAYHALSSDRMGQSTESALSSAAASIMRLSEKDPSLKELAERLQTASLEISDCAREIHYYGDNLEFSPAMLEEVENRLSLIRSLKRKYGADIENILQKAEDIKSQLEMLSSSQEDLSALKSEIRSRQQSLGQQAERLYKERKIGAERLKKAVENELGDLNMPSVRFEVDLKIEEAQNGLPFSDGKRYAYNEYGVGLVQFMASTNPGESFKPLNKIASTGEMSRFTLALKSALAMTDDTPTLVFDEIDIGVGARSGHVLGKKIYNLSRRHQVICVTHLAQIAAYADSHLSVRKESSKGFTQSSLHELKDEAVLEELGLMLSGAESATRSEAAAEVWQMAREYKNTR